MALMHPFSWPWSPSRRRGEERGCKGPWVPQTPKVASCDLQRRPLGDPASTFRVSSLSVLSCHTPTDLPSDRDNL